ncbi:MAG: hypothetical protein WAL24_02260 [Nitrososphaeraceae archaeon]
MIIKNKEIDSIELTKLLQDSTIVRIVSIIGNTSLSILELLEYNFTRRDINYALASGVIGIDKSSSSSSQSSLNSPDLNLDESNILVSGDYYFYNFLNNKVKITELGMYILETIKAGNKTMGNVIPKDVEGQQKQYFSSQFSHG